MTLLPPPPSGSELPRESSGLPQSSYEDQRAAIVQILKDMPNRFAPPRVSPDNQRAPRPIPPDEVSDGHSHLTTEGLADDKYTRSRQQVEDQLSRLKDHNLNAYLAIATVFLDPDAGHSNYDRLVCEAGPALANIEKGLKQLSAKKASAKVILEYLRENTTPKVALLRDLNVALHQLTMMLLDKQLYARMPAKIASSKTFRRQQMEESYKEIYRVFRAWCEDLKTKHNRYRNKAIENTIIQTNESRSTVKRAISFNESGEAHTAVARSYKKVS